MSTRSVALGELFAGLAAWKSGAPRPADVLRAAAVCVGEGGEDSSADVGTDPGSDAGAGVAARAGLAGEAFVDAFRAGAMPLAKADQVARFVRDVRPVADPDALAADVAALVGAASGDHRGRGFSSRELARPIRFAALLIRPASDLEDDEQRRRLGRAPLKSCGPAGCRPTESSSTRRAPP